MADNPRTLMLNVKADIEVARTQLENLVGIMGKSAADVDTNLGRIEDAFKTSGDRISGRSMFLATTIGSAFGSVLGGIVGRIPSELMRMGESALQSAASIKNTAAALGISTDALQDFRLGAASAGVAVATADAALETFQKTTGKAANGNKAAAAAFKAIGVDIADSSGHLKPFETLIGEVADGLMRLPDPAREAAAAQQLFGESGANLLPFLSQGAKGINDLAAANELLGIKMTPETIARLDHLGNKSEAIGKVLTAQMAAAIAENADAIIALGNAAGDAVGYVAQLLAYVKGLAAVRANEGFLAQFTSDFGRTAQMGTPGGAVQVYGAEYMAAKKKRQDAETNGYPGIFVDNFKLLEDQAHARYTAAVAANEAGRPAATKPGAAVTGGVVVPIDDPMITVSARRDKAAKAARGKTGFDLQGGIDRLLASPAQKSKELTGLSGQVSTALAQIDGSAETLVETLDKAFDTHAADDFANSIPRITDELDDAAAAGEELTRGLALGLASIITQGGDMGDKLVGVFARIGESMLSSGLLNLFSGGEQGTSFGTLFKGITGLFGGARADGGPVTGGLPYLVGERGPEIVVPGMSGSVIPNHALRAAGGAASRSGVVQNFDLRGAMVTEDVMARIDAAASQAAMRGAIGGRALAAEDRARQARRRL